MNLQKVLICQHGRPKSICGECFPNVPVPTKRSELRTRAHQCETPDAKCDFMGIVYWRDECLLWLCPPHFLVPCQGHCVMSPHQPLKINCTYQELVAEYKRLRAAEGSGVGDPAETEAAHFAAQVAVQKAVKDSQDAWFELMLLKVHICQNCWDESDICSVCGADGRQ